MDCELFNENEVSSLKRLSIRLKTAITIVISMSTLSNQSCIKCYNQKQKRFVHSYKLDTNYYLPIHRILYEAFHLYNNSFYLVMSPYVILIYNRLDQ